MRPGLLESVTQLNSHALWRLAALNLQRNRRRSLLSISIIAIAVLAFVVVN
ncbi:hypothetical protein VCSRO95_3464 [Vibrio cholerae]|nr:hypothetical protein VCSRO95_3464 [Vibrio cholerae]